MASPAAAAAELAKLVAEKKRKSAHGTTCLRDRRSSLVAATKAQLVSGTLAGPINRNENGDVIGQTVWTGTAADGGATPNRCSDWTSSAANDFATVGISDQSGAGWTGSAILGCSSNLAIYCFQVP